LSDLASLLGNVTIAGSMARRAGSEIDTPSVALRRLGLCAR
jgi:hypothetical protein